MAFGIVLDYFKNFLPHCCNLSLTFAQLRKRISNIEKFRIVFPIIFCPIYFFLLQNRHLRFGSGCGNGSISLIIA